MPKRRKVGCGPSVVSSVEVTCCVLAVDMAGAGTLTVTVTVQPSRNQVIPQITNSSILRFSSRARHAIKSSRKFLVTSILLSSLSVLDYKLNPHGHAHLRCDCCRRSAAADDESAGSWVSRARAHYGEHAARKDLHGHTRVRGEPDKLGRRWRPTTEDFS